MSPRPTSDAAALLRALSDEERERLVKVLAQLLIDDERERDDRQRKRSMT